MKRLRIAMAHKAARDRAFSGTTTAVERLCKGVSHQQIRNLLDEGTPPWNVRVSTMQELVRVFGPMLKPEHFYRP